MVDREPPRPAARLLGWSKSVRHVGTQCHQAEEGPAVQGQLADSPFLNDRADGCVLGAQQFRPGLHFHRLRRVAHFEMKIDTGCLLHLKFKTHHRGLEALGSGLHLVLPGRQVGETIEARAIGHRGTRHVRSGVCRGDGNRGHDRTAGISYLSSNLAACLRQNHARRRAQQSYSKGESQHRDSSTRISGLKLQLSKRVSLDSRHVNGNVCVTSSAILAPLITVQPT